MKAIKAIGMFAIGAFATIAATVVCIPLGLIALAYFVSGEDD